MNNPKLTDVMKNITVNIGDEWINPNIYTGTKEDLISAGLAQEFMFAEHPKRNMDGSFDCKGNRIDNVDYETDEYDWRGETRHIFWTTKRTKGGRFELRIDKSWEEKEKLAHPPLDRDMYQALIYTLTGFYMKRFIDSVFGDVPGNPNKYQLSNAKDVERAATQLKSTILKGNIINTPRLSVI